MSTIKIFAPLRNRKYVTQPFTHGKQDKEHFKTTPECRLYAVLTVCIVCRLFIEMLMFFSLSLSPSCETGGVVPQCPQLTSCHWSCSLLTVHNCNINNGDCEAADVKAVMAFQTVIPPRLCFQARYSADYVSDPSIDVAIKYNASEHIDLDFNLTQNTNTQYINFPGHSYCARTFCIYVFKCFL